MPKNQALKQKKTFDNSLSKVFFVVPPGLEPRITEPKSAVLPLHHDPMLLKRGKNTATFQSVQGV